jgi:hypothetical protein
MYVNIEILILDIKKIQNIKQKILFTDKKEIKLLF